MKKKYVKLPYEPIGRLSMALMYITIVLLFYGQ